MTREIAERMQRMMAKYGTNPNAIAAASGTDRISVYRIANGQNDNPTTKTLMAIVRAAGGTMSEFWEDLPARGLIGGEDGFREVVDFDGSVFAGYRINAQGRIESCRRNGKGEGLSSEWRVMQPPMNNYGYRVASLSRGDGQVAPRQVHALVLLAFVGPPGEDQQCRHLDGNRSNNRVENLQWGTAKENRDDQDRHGTAVKGTKVNTAKLTEDQVREIRRIRAEEGASYAKIGEMFGIQRTTICQITSGRSWKHLL